MIAYYHGQVGLVADGRLSSQPLRRRSGKRLDRQAARSLLTPSLTGEAEHLSQQLSGRHFASTRPILSSASLRPESAPGAGRCGGARPEEGSPLPSALCVREGQPEPSLCTRSRTTPGGAGCAFLYLSQRRLLGHGIALCSESGGKGEVSGGEAIAALSGEPLSSRQRLEIYLKRGKGGGGGGGEQRGRRRRVPSRSRERGASAGRGTALPQLCAAIGGARAAVGSAALSPLSARGKDGEGGAERERRAPGPEALPGGAQ